MQGLTNALKDKNKGSPCCKMVGSRLLLGSNSYIVEVVASNLMGTIKIIIYLFLFLEHLYTIVKCLKLEMLDEVQQSNSMDSLNICFELEKMHIFLDLGRALEECNK
jgi:hypothetical protein